MRGITSWQTFVPAGKAGSTFLQFYLCEKHIFQSAKALIDSKRTMMLVEKDLIECESQQKLLRFQVVNL